MTNINSGRQATNFRLFVLVGSAIGLAILASLAMSVVLIFQSTAGENATAATAFNITLLKISQLVLTIATFFIPVFLLAKMSGVSTQSLVQADKKISIFVLISAVVLILSIQPLMNATSVWFSDWSLPPFLSGLEHWFKTVEKGNLALVSRFLDVHSLGGLLFNILVVAIVPAICEEFFFRGGMQPLFCEKMNQHAAVWLTAIIFSAIHMEIGGFLPRMVLGASFGYLLIWTGSIWVPVTMHFINNLFGVVVEYLIFNGYADKSLEQFGTGATLWVSLLGTIVFAGILLLFFRIGKMEHATSIQSADI